MIKRSRKHEGENLDRWLLTYSDMITLLMAFFIMMYSMSVLNVNRFRQAAISIRSGFGGIVKGQGKNVFGATGVSNVTAPPIAGDVAGVPWRVVKPLVNQIKNSDLKKGSVSIGEDERGIVISMMSDNVIFQPGSAQLKPGAYSLLNNVSAMIKKTENQVQVEGHTCDLSPRNSKYPSNWELSTARATNVLRYIVNSKKLGENRFSAAGYGSVKPVAPNNSENNRRKNRRVEIVILRPEMCVGSIIDDSGKKPKNVKSEIRARRD